MIRIAVLSALLLAPDVARAQSHAVTVRNGAADTIRAIQIGPAGRLGENRMRSQLPAGAEARITYSTGCDADVRLTFASGQTEDHAGLDVCTDPRIIAGQAGAAGPVAQAPVAGGGPRGGVQTAATAPGRGKPAAAAPIDKTPVPPWTGRSITRRFGGMD